MNIRNFLEEDGALENFGDQRIVQCQLNIKSDCLLAGLPYFCEVFQILGSPVTLEGEGNFFEKGQSLKFSLPFSVAVRGERLALNLLQKATSIATLTQKVVSLSGPIKILDTRKTTPGLRELEKYAVRIGGGYNHRWTQNDCWMIKDNHKNVFGGIEKAYEYFQGLKQFYRPVVVEVHDLEELKTCQKLSIKHVMLDNFSPEKIQEAMKMKGQMTYEVSGGITLENLEQYLIPGVDAISMGHLTYGAPGIDLSLKYV